jgi:sugar phosphate permease
MRVALWALVAVDVLAGAVAAAREPEWTGTFITAACAASAIAIVLLMAVARDRI